MHASQFYYFYFLFIAVVVIAVVGVVVWIVLTYFFQNKREKNYEKKNFFITNLSFYWQQFLNYKNSYNTAEIHFLTLVSHKSYIFSLSTHFSRGRLAAPKPLSYLVTYHTLYFLY